MTNNTKQVLVWLKEFQNIWLPEKLANDVPLLESINNKLLELEHLVNGKNIFVFFLRKKNLLYRKQ
jgi:hypothetical protein